jgi:hypothetical protein
VRTTKRAGRSRGAVTDTSGIGTSRWALDLRVERRTTRTATKVRSEVSDTRRVGRGLLLFQRPLLLRAVDLAEVVDARIGLGRGARFDEVGDRDRGEEADDGHNDHDFNQREARVTGVTDFHINVNCLSSNAA